MCINFLLRFQFSSGFGQIFQHPADSGIQRFQFFFSQPAAHLFSVSRKQLQTSAAVSLPSSVKKIWHSRRDCGLMRRSRSPFPPAGPACARASSHRGDSSLQFPADCSRLLSKGTSKSAAVPARSSAPAVNIPDASVPCAGFPV